MFRRERSVAVQINLPGIRTKIATWQIDARPVNRGLTAHIKQRAFPLGGSTEERTRASSLYYGWRRQTDLDRT